MSQLSFLSDPRRFDPASYGAHLQEMWERHLDYPGPDAPTVASTFAGGGGSSLGYSMAGYREVGATDWEAHCCETLRHNFPDLNVVEGDIADVTAAEFLADFDGDLDVLDGSPPCQGFSTAGKRRRTDSRNYLFEQFVRLLGEIKPRAFVMENVTGLVKGHMKPVFTEIFRELQASGYVVRAWTLNAKYFHVPQNRARVIFIGIREDLGIEPTAPQPESAPITVRESTGIGGIRLSGHGYFGGSRVDGAEPSSTILGTGMGSFGYEVERERAVHDMRSSRRSGGDSPSGWAEENRTRLKAGMPAPTIGAEGVAGVRQHQAGVEVISLEGTAVGRALEEEGLEPGEQSARYYSLKREDPDAPASTVQASHGERGIASPVHPIERRKFTIPEVMTLCSFPPAFWLPEKYTTAWHVVGNAVPPLMMEAIARHVRGLLGR